jgi:hypothetical protein
MDDSYFILGGTGNQQLRCISAVHKNLVVIELTMPLI